MSRPADITPERLRLFAPHCDYLAFAPRLDRTAKANGIASPRRVRHWLAHVYVETFGLTRFVENLSYSAERLRAVWPKRFPTLAAAKPYARNPAALAEKVYGGRLGNTRPGEGARYIGRGGLMRTGRAGYAEAALAFRGRGVTVDLLASPELLAQPDYAFDDAAHFWADHGLNDAADADEGERIFDTVQEAILGNEVDDLESTTRRINGGLTGWEERKRALLSAGAIWRDA